MYSYMCIHTHHILNGNKSDMESHFVKTNTSLKDHTLTWPEPDTYFIVSYLAAPGWPWGSGETWAVKWDWGWLQEGWEWWWSVAGIISCPAWCSSVQKRVPADFLYPQHAQQSGTRGQAWTGEGRSDKDLKRVINNTQMGVLDITDPPASTKYPQGINPPSFHCTFASLASPGSMCRPWAAPGPWHCPPSSTGWHWVGQLPPGKHTAGRKRWSHGPLSSPLSRREQCLRERRIAVLIKPERWEEWKEYKELGGRKEKKEQ